jgi:hypothetical protein
MAEDRNTIAQELTDEQLDRFVRELAALPKKERQLKHIRHKAAELGITISLMSATSFRNTTFQRYLAKMEKAQKAAQLVEDVDRGGSTLADASAKLLSKRIFDQLMDAEDEDSAEVVDLDQMTLAVARLRRGNVQQAALEEKIKQLQVAQLDAAAIVLKQTRELKTIADDKTIDETEKVERIRRRLFGEAPAAAPSTK